MTDNAWTRWPSREALGREATTRPRRLLGWVTRSLVLALLLWGVLNRSHVQGWGVLGAVAGILLSAAVAWALFRTTLEHRLWPSLAFYGVLLAIAVAWSISPSVAPGKLYALVASTLLIGGLYVALMLPLALRDPLGIYVRPWLATLRARRVKASAKEGAVGPERGDTG